ncbi:MAG TPA: hypothetical protein VH413_18765 [Verrucomicrobiae bacterium]|jgi:hypothetical protein|nr:hypothetical protein [Verrucomicrobiae bacterium]
MNSLLFLSRKLRWGFLTGILWFSTTAVFGQAPIFTNAAIVGGFFQVQILISSNTTFTIQTSTNLATGWTSVGSMKATNNLITLIDNRGMAGMNRQFYRIFLGSTASFDFNFLEFADAGGFGGNFTPSVTFPVALDNYSANFGVKGDTNLPAAPNVFFTGPAGSGLANSPADPANSSTNSDHGNGGNYQSAIISSPAIAPGGTWTVNYKGSNVMFSVPDPQAASHLVIPFPTATVSSGMLQSVSWVYRDATTGATLAGPPVFMTSIQLQVHGNSSANELFDSDNLPPGTTNSAVTSSVTWSDVSGVSMAYNDSLGNNYIINFVGPIFGH